MQNKIIVAIDGPAGSGKSSVSRAVARDLGWQILDTGAVYRSFTLFLQKRRLIPSGQQDLFKLDRVKKEIAESATRLLDEFFSSFIISTDPASPLCAIDDISIDQDIRGQEVTESVSFIASVPIVRQRLNEYFRQKVESSTSQGFVVEGRDITTVVFKDADIKILLTANEKVRAQRRMKDVSANYADRHRKSESDRLKQTEAQSEKSHLESLRNRDKRDLSIVNFMETEGDVEVIDSTDLNFEETVAVVKDKISVFLNGVEQPKLKYIPTVAIVGRPNVGKSALVNRIIGRNEAVVQDTPGITRDRVQYKAEYRQKHFFLFDTGGWEPNAKELDKRVAEIAQAAVHLADICVFVTDVTTGPTGTDERFVSVLRASKKPVFVLVNKVDSDALAFDVASFWTLGLGAPLAVSALHGRGVADFLDQLIALFDDIKGKEDTYTQYSRVAIVGRPNVGKSSLLNKMAKENRSLVSAVPGTTRDPVDEIVNLGGKTWHFVDTAGIRKRFRFAHGAEYYASLRTFTAISRAEVAVVVLDASQALGVQDIRIIESVILAGRALVLVFNKWDILTDTRRLELAREIDLDLGHVSWAPRVNLSAHTGKNVQKLSMAISTSLKSWKTRIPTAKLNAFFTAFIRQYPHPVSGGKQPKILYVTQVQVSPPTFVLFTSGYLNHNYRRFIQRRIREEFGFEGTPIDLQMRIRENRFADSH